MENTKKVPVLRFPEFSREWECKTLGELSEISSGGTPNRANQHFWNGSIPWVSTALIDFNLIDRAEEYITEEGLKNSSAKLYPVGTLLMAMYGQGKTRGKIAILNIEASTNQACASIITNKEVLNNLFAFQNISKRYNEIRDLSNQGGQENLSGGIIKKINISFPSIQEQQKIADFLSQIDNRIEKLTKKKQLLESYKKGVMKKIFNQELRFKDDNGNDYPDWEVKTLGEMAKFRRGSFPQPYGLDKWYDDINGMPFIQVFDVDDNFRLKDKTKRKISKEAQIQSVFVKTGSTLITIQGSIGRIAITQYDAYVDRTLLLFESFKVKINKYYFAYVLFLLFEIEKEKADGSIIKTITKESLTDFEIFICDYVEQTKIANFLTEIDDKINQTKSQLEGTKQYKKGLLQKMFV